MVLADKLIPYQQESHSAHQEASRAGCSPNNLDISSLSLSDNELTYCFMYCGDCHCLTRTVSDSGNKYLGGVAACEVCGALREIGTIIDCGLSSDADGKSKL